nr:DUF1835 domain-containing protein [Vannielia litorea]
MGRLGRGRRAEVSTLHLIPGLSAGGALRQHLRASGDAGRVIALYDCFDIGAIPRGDDPLEVAIRRGRAEATRTGDAEFAARAADDMAALAMAVDSAEGIALWAGETLQEQFALAFAIALATHRGKADSLALHQLHLPGPLKSIGNHQPGDFAEAPKARPLTRAEAALYPALWRALQAPTPEPLLALRRDPALPVPLRAALDAHFARFPHAATGLGAREERVLAQLSEEWRLGAHLISHALAWWEDAMIDMVGDLDLLTILRSFAARPEDQPVVEIREEGRARFGFSARLTAYGAALARGGASLVEDGGIDAQIGGVRIVSGAGPLWLRTGGAEILARRD